MPLQLPDRNGRQTPGAPLRLFLEPGGLRVKGHQVEFLFSELDDRHFWIVYEAAMAFVSAALPRSEPAPPFPRFSSHEANQLRQAIALHWIYFYNINRMAIEMAEEDLQHPETKRIVRKHAARRCSDTREAAVLGAATLGISVSDYESWMQSDDEFLSMR